MSASGHPQGAGTRVIPSGNPALLSERRITPMQAAAALYSEGGEEVAEALVASLSAQVFDMECPSPSSRLRQRLAGVVFHIVKNTTREDARIGAAGEEYIAYRNFILERSGHPYAYTLLEPSGAHTASFVEGGDAMNGPYMMISPEIRRNANGWDRALLDSVVGKDVQLRFIWETRATRDAAKRYLDRGEPVRIKAAAAGTGLSLILAFDRLLREGYDPAMITATVTDREAANVTKARRLMAKLRSTRPYLHDGGRGPGITARVEDLLIVPPVAALADPATEVVTVESGETHDVITLVGILEYFHGFTCATTEDHLGEASPAEEAAHARHLVGRIGQMTTAGGALIANTYRVGTGSRILELFGKRLRYRNRGDLHTLAETGGFLPHQNVGSGNVYDVEVFRKSI